MLDNAFFKILARNDTAAAPGHQGGIVIPKDLVPFFPPLPVSSDPDNPTTETRIRATLLVGGVPVDEVETRYQYQTWHTRRAPEARLTGNLAPIRKVAQKGDILVFARYLDDGERMQLDLVRAGTPLHERLLRQAGKRRWGAVVSSDPPVSRSDYDAAGKYLRLTEDQTFEMFRPEIARREARVVRIARDAAFRERLLGLYDSMCAFSGKSLLTPAGEIGLDAAHIVPVESAGTDHPANGIVLAKDIHWAFDKGLIGVADDRTVVVPAIVRSLAPNRELGGLHGRRISESAAVRFRARPECFAWHRDKILVR